MKTKGVKKVLFIVMMILSLTTASAASVKIIAHSEENTQIPVWSGAKKILLFEGTIQLEEDLSRVLIDTLKLEMVGYASSPEWEGAEMVIEASGNYFTSTLHEGKIIVEGIYVKYISDLKITIDLPQTVSIGSQAKFEISGRATNPQNDEEVEVIGAKTPVLQVVNYSNQAKIVNNYDWEIEVSPLLANDGSPCQIFEGKIETEHNLPFLLQSLMLTVLSAEDNTQSTTFDDLQVHLFLNGVEGTYREAKIEQGKAVFDDLDKIASSGEMVRLFVSTPIGDDIVGEEFFFKISAETETLLGEKGEVAPFITQSFQIKKKRQTVRLSARNIGEGEFTINGEDGETYIHSYESWYLLYYFGEELSFDYIESDDNYQFKSWRVESPDGIYITSSPTLNLTIRDYRGYLFPYAVEAQFEKKAITSSISAVKQESGVKIWGNDGILHMSSQSMQNIQIYSLFGQLVFQDQIEGEWQRSFPKGIYVVKPENQPAQKIKL